MLGGIVFLMLAGVTQSLAMVCHAVILLRASGQRLRGRIMGVRMLAIYSLPLGLLAAGALIERIGLSRHRNDLCRDRFFVHRTGRGALEGLPVETQPLDHGG